MKKQLTPLVAALLVSAPLLSGTAQAAGDIEAGQTKSATCAACHGPDGNSPNPIWPKLAGQSVGYILDQLGKFKAGERNDPLMTPMAAPLSEEDMADLAAYFSSQKRQLGSAEADKVALGEQLYRAGDAKKGLAACSSCHGPSGAGIPAANFPGLSGQHAAYVEKALKDFRDGNRSTDLNKMMRDLAGKMSDTEIAAVSQYVQGLR
ncbi:MAG: cytochrome c4 [Gammaproteobacteria bacterium SHHR-1]|uniref:c-type cytochrome n=1 Tax=Magnetovirga frankeli TaxID=947516 RepID=UPI0012935B3F|nr:cytochrome c4 [gamma proteobacterium SS-5]